MKHCSFKVAKAIKEAGYPQELHECTIFYSENGLMDKYDSELYELFEPMYCTAPTYLEVWLWLWRTRGFYIDIAHYYDSDEVTMWDNNYNKIISIECMGKYRDPEEVIKKAIEYLVDNNLIK